MRLKTGNMSKIFACRLLNYPASSIDCAPPLNLEYEPKAHAFTDSRIPHHYSLYHSAEAPFVCEIPNATIATVQNLVFDDEYFYLDSYHNEELMKTIVPVAPVFGPLESGTIHCDISTLNQSEYQGTAVMFVGPHSANYHHWILEVLSRLWILDEFPEYRELPLIMSNMNNKFQSETLDKIWKSLPRNSVSFNGSLKVDRLVFSSMMAPGGHSRVQLDWLRSKLLSRMGKLKRMIYISRRDEVNPRTPENEDDLIEKLQDIGFEVVVLTGKSHEDQVELFVDAKIVMGVSGAGITNHIFAPEGAHVIEFHPSDYTNRAHFFTSNLLDQTYQFVICERDLSGNLHLPIDRILKCVDQVV